MIDIDWAPERKKLRDFGLLLGLICLVWAAQGAWRAGAFGSGPLVDVAAIPWFPRALVIAGAIAGILGLTVPQVLRPIYVGWMVVAFPIAWVVSNVLLGVTYFVVFTAFATIFRLLGRDQLQRRLDRDARSYWQERKPQPPPSRYFNQF